MRAASLSLLLMAVAGCGSPRPAARPVATIEPVARWEATITAADRTRFDRLEATWQSARAGLSRRAARAATAEGALTAPGGALDQPLPSPGPYRCRRLQMGGNRGGFLAGKPGFCAVTIGDQGNSFVVQTGTDRPDGWLYPVNATRLVFLGGIAAGASTHGPAYGAAATSDAVGAFERIGPFRWRLAMPRRDAGVDIYELIPVPPRMKGDVGAVQASS